MTVFCIHINVWGESTTLFSSSYASNSLTPKNPVCDFILKIPHMDKKFVANPLLPTSKRFPYLRNLCKECLNQELVIVHKDAIVVCTRCGYIMTTNLLEDESSEHCPFIPNVKQKRKFTPDYQKRRNHFRFWLQRLQGKEPNKLSREDMISIQSFIKQRFHDNTEWDYSTMKKCLKMMQKEEWYNHIYYILKTVCHQPLVEFTSYHEDILVDMFLTIQSPFAEYRDRRINMLNYAYLLRKFTEIQGWVHLSDQIPYVKSHVKLYNLDCIWKKICNKIGFPFIKSIH